MVGFSKIVKIRAKGCKKCFSIFYVLPCNLNPNIAKYLKKSFGSPLYNINIVKLLRINTSDGFRIEGVIGEKKIKFSMSKNYEKLHPNNIPKRKEFEESLAEWMSDTLKINVVR